MRQPAAVLGMLRTAAVLALARRRAGSHRCVRWRRSTVPTGVATVPDGRRGRPGQLDEAADQRSPVRATKLSGQIHHADKVGRRNDRCVRDLLRRHAPFAGTFIRLPAVSLAPSGIPPIVTVAPIPGELTLTPSDSGSLTGPLPSRTHQRRSGLALQRRKQG